MVQTIVSAFILIFSLNAHARTLLFEGYYKISSGDQHIGFAISRYEFDGKQKKFYSTQFTKLSSAGTEVIESLNAVSESDDFMTPVSYKYVSMVGKDSKIIDAKFTKSAGDKIKMSAVVSESGKKPIKILNDLPPKVFLSTFLSYRLLKSPKGIQTKTQEKYAAIAEEDGQVENGSVNIMSEEKYKGFTAFKINNSFKKNTFLSYLTDKGEALAVIVNDARLTSELVADKAEAIGTVGIPESVIKTLFGSTPRGEKNIVSHYFKRDTQTVTPQNGGKQEGFPAGQGIHIKNQPQPSKEEP